MPWIAASALALTILPSLQVAAGRTPSLCEAVELSLASNLDLAIERLSPDVAEADRKSRSVLRLREGTTLDAWPDVSDAFQIETTRSS